MVFRGDRAGGGRRAGGSRLSGEIAAATPGEAEGEPEGTERRCVATWQVKPTGEMVRFVLGPQQVVVPDVAGRLPGRGMWVTASRTAIEQAARGGFAKSAKASVKAPDGLADQVEALLIRRALNVLGLAKRAGEVVTGFDRVFEAIAAGRVAVLVQAVDASESGRAKLAAKARAMGGVARVDCFSVAELGLALGQENVVHAAVAPGGLARRLLDDTARLHGFRPRLAVTGDGGLDTE